MLDETKHEYLRYTDFEEMNARAIEDTDENIDLKKTDIVSI